MLRRGRRARAAPAPSPENPKFSALGLGQEAYRHGDCWEREPTTAGERLVIGPRAGHVEVMIALMEEFSAPFGILYVLAVPRGAEGGRYQSPTPTDRKKTERFLREFAPFFEGDGRHAVWVQEVEGMGLLVYDHHDIIFAYGPLDAFERRLRERGMKEGPVRIPSPHAHAFNGSFDGVQNKLLRHWKWIRTPLQEGDD